MINAFIIKFTKWLSLGLAVTLALSIFPPMFVLASDYNSANFISRDPIQSNLGGQSSSSSFKQMNSGAQPATGESTSSSYILKSGFMYFDTFTPMTQNWRWYSDYTNETPTTAMASENTAPNVDNLNIIKLRVTVKEIANIGEANVKYKLQFSTSSNFSSGVNDVVEIGSCSTTTSLWCYADGGGTDNVKITTKVLTDADSCASSAGNGCGTHNESGASSSSYTHPKSAAAEHEFTIERAGAPLNTTFYFRLYNTTNNLPVTFNSGKSYPSVVTSGANLTFSLTGLSAGQVTNGGVTVSSTVTSSSSSVNFGDLSLYAFGSQVNAAQRFAVSTNATNGYQVLAFQTQGLLGPGGAQIPAISTTNASPGTWASACSSSQTGCYGYHTEDGSLSGGSPTRFSTNDTYAQFDSTAREIVYASGPVTSDTTDFVYRTQITNQQQTGTYTSSVVYIVVVTY